MDQLALSSASDSVAPFSVSCDTGVFETMEKKILTIMAVLIVVAAIVVAFVMVAAGGVRTAGGFTRLFNDLENETPSVTYGQYLSLPDDWNEQDSKTVSDTIVDMVPLREEVIGGITIHTVRLYFVYIDDKWADDESGVGFYVPSTEDGSSGYIYVSHGMFHIDVSSSENIVEDYNIGDVITLKTVLELNEDNDGELSFSSWLLG